MRFPLFRDAPHRFILSPARQSTGHR